MLEKEKDENVSLAYRGSGYAFLYDVWWMGQGMALKDGWGCEISELQDENTCQFRKAKNTDVQYD